MSFTFRTGDIFYSPKRPGLYYIVTNDNTNLGGYGPGSIEFCKFPQMNRPPFYKLPRHLNDQGFIKLT
jgi:hypothetical protein